MVKTKDGDGGKWTFEEVMEDEWKLNKVVEVRNMVTSACWEIGYCSAICNPFAACSVNECMAVYTSAHRLAAAQ